MKVNKIFIFFLIERVVCADDKAKGKTSGRIEYHEAKRTEHQNYFKSVMTSLGELSKVNTNQKPLKEETTSDLNSVANYFNKKVKKHNKIIKDIHSGNKIEGEKTVEHITKKRKLNSGQTANPQVGTSRTNSSP